MTITGRVTSVLVLENRHKLFILHVLADEYTNHYNTADIGNIFLDGVPAARASDIAKFVESRHVRAECHNPDYSTSGTGSTLCEKIELFEITE